MGEIRKLSNRVLRPIGCSRIDDCDDFPREVVHMTTEARRLIEDDPRFLSTERNEGVSQHRTSLDIAYALGVASKQMKYAALYRQNNVSLPRIVVQPIHMTHVDMLYRPIGEGMVTVGIGSKVLRVNGYNHFSGLVIDGPCAGMVVRKHRSGNYLLDSVLNTFPMTQYVRDELGEGQIIQPIEGYEYSVEEIMRAEIHAQMQACCEGRPDAYSHEVMIEMASNVGITLHPDFFMTMRIPQ